MLRFLTFGEIEKLGEIMLAALALAVPLVTVAYILAA